MKDFYKELGMDKSMSLQDIQKKIFQERKKWVTRQNTSDPEKQKIAVDKLNILNEAAEVFEDDESRREYDRKLANEANKETAIPSTKTTTASTNTGTRSTSNNSNSTANAGKSSSNSSGTTSKSSSYTTGTGSYSPRKKKGKGCFFFLLFIILIICLFKRHTISRYLNSGVDRQAIEFNGHSYMLYDDADGWADAREKCEKLGGHLASITDEEENRTLSSYVTQNGYNEVFFGLYNAGKADDPIWTWVTDETFKYTAWNEGEPNSSDENYGQYLDGGWNDCVNSAGSGIYICEWDYLPGDEEHEKGISNIIDLAMNIKNSVMKIVRKTDYTLERVEYSKSLIENMDRIVVNEVDANSYLTDENGNEYPAQNLIDDSSKTCWREGEDGLGEGTNLKFSFEDKKELSYILIRPGNAKSKSAYKKCARPSLITVTINGVFETCRLADSNKWQAITLHGNVMTDCVTITINSVYEGSTKEDTCISEVRFY